MPIVNAKPNQDQHQSAQKLSLDTLRPQDLLKVSSMEKKPIPEIVKGWIKKGALHLITGEPGAMKTMLAQQLAGAISTGAEVLGSQTASSMVIYVDKENTDSLVMERFELLGISNDTNLHYWGMWCDPQPPQIPDRIYLRWAEEYKPVFIFDSLIRFHDKEENYASEMRSVSAFLRALCARGATVIVLHHRGKPRFKGRSSDYRGSSEIAAGCDLGYSITKSVKDGEDPVLEVKCFKNRYAPECNHQLRFDSAKGLFVPELTAARLKEQKQIEGIENLIVDVPGIDFGEIQINTPIPEKKLRELLKKGEGKHWECGAGAHNKYRYFPIEDSDGD